MHGNESVPKSGNKMWWWWWWRWRWCQLRSAAAVAAAAAVRANPTATAATPFQVWMVTRQKCPQACNATQRNTTQCTLTVRRASGATTREVWCGVTAQYGMVWCGVVRYLEGLRRGGEEQLAVADAHRRPLHPPPPTHTHTYTNTINRRNRRNTARQEGDDRHTARGRQDPPRRRRRSRGRSARRRAGPRCGPAAPRTPPWSPATPSLSPI